MKRFKVEGSTGLKKKKRTLLFSFVQGLATRERCGVSLRPEQGLAGAAGARRNEASRSDPPDEN